VTRRHQGLAITFASSTPALVSGPPDDEEDGVLILGTVPNHLLAELGHERARPHRTARRGRIALLPVPTHQGAVEHRDVAVVGAKCGRLKLLPLDNRNI